MSDLRLPSTNHIVIAGRLTRDAESRALPSGTQLTKLGIACSRRFKKDGEQREETVFVNCTAWSKLAEWTSNLKKGRPVMVEGRLTMNEWTDSASGQKRSQLEILASSVTPLDWEEQAGGASPRAANRAESEQGLMDDGEPPF